MKKRQLELMIYDIDKGSEIERWLLTLKRNLS